MDGATAKSWYKKWWGGLIIIALILFLIILAIFAVSVFRKIKQIQSGELLSPDQLKNQVKYEAEGKNDYWIGSANPKVTIVEFADFACPYSKNSFPKIREISVKYKDSVKIIFRNFPYLTEYSLELALAARCAGEQGLFWPMHDKLYISQGIKTAAELSALANRLGADLNRFNDCLTAKKYLPQIQEDLTDAEKLKINGTPTWFVNGYKVEGDLPLEAFKQIIESFINNKI